MHTHTDADDVASERMEDAARMRLYTKLAEENRTAATNCFELTHSRKICVRWERMAEHYQLSADTLRKRLLEGFR